MKIKKPNWTPLELNEKLMRWSRLRHEIESHEPDCDCNRCFEWFGTGELLALFTEDEKATAVIESKKQNTETK